MRYFLLAALIATSLSWLAIVRTDGFSPSIVQGNLLKEKEGIVPYEIREILSQDFCYLAKGRQSFVFESRDQKYVIKFFNQKYFQLPWYSFLLGEKEQLKRDRRRFFYKNSYALAKEEFGEEILYLHEGPSDSLPIISLVDRASRHFLIDLNQTPFVLQRKGIPFYQHLRALYENKGGEALCTQIDQFLEAVKMRIEKKIADADSDVEHNWGVIHGRLFHLDPGRLYYDENLDADMELRSATRKLHKWLFKNYPEIIPYFEKRLSLLFI